MEDFNELSDETYVEGMKPRKRSKPGVRGTLRFVTGTNKNQVVNIDKEAFTIGRSKDCSLCLKDKKVSRIHCQLIQSLGKEIVEDLGSSNGTKVNGHHISKKILTDGDVVQLGSTSLEYKKA